MIVYSYKLSKGFLTSTETFGADSFILGFILWALYTKNTEGSS